MATCVYVHAPRSTGGSRSGVALGEDWPGYIMLCYAMLCAALQTASWHAIRLDILNSARGRSASGHLTRETTQSEATWPRDRTGSLPPPLPAWLAPRGSRSER